MNRPISCDTFVCLPPNTLNNSVIFGKNSDRPEKEVQEIIYQPHGVYKKGTKLRCTYIEIDQVEETCAVILSKPSWMWGAEMGANENGVCIGNEAVWTQLINSREDIQEKLLGMDLVRLGLERSKSARGAVEVITDLLDKYGQGGPCSDTMRNWSYHNSFLIADKKEAWVLETAGTLWAAEQITSGFRNISNSLSIGVKIDLMSRDLKDQAFKLGFWDGKEPFNFSKAFSDSYTDPETERSGRFFEGTRLLREGSKERGFSVKSMMDILRDVPSGICMGCDGSFVSTSSQVSVLNALLDCHWFTGTPDPEHSLFKPFVFIGTDGNSLSDSVKSPVEDEDSETFRRITDRRHVLYKEHGTAYKILKKRRDLQLLKGSFSEIEAVSISYASELFLKFDKDKEDKHIFNELQDLFNADVCKELEFYANITSTP